MSTKGSTHAPTDTQTDPPMIFTKLSDGALAKNLCVKFGTDQNHVVACGADEQPIGVTTTAATGAEQPVQVTTFTGAVTMTANGAWPHGQFLATAANGQVKRTDALGVGVHYFVGAALQDASGTGITGLVAAGLFIREI